MNLHDTYYAFPQASYLLIFLFPILALFWALFNYRNKILQQFATETIVPRSTLIFFVKVIALCLSWIFATIALMQPISYGTYPEAMSSLKQKPHAIILLIDTSASMSVDDMRSGQTRLDVAKEVAEDIVNKLDGQLVALEAFTSEVTPLSPLTTSYTFVVNMIKKMQINTGGVPGTDLLDALKSMREKYFSLSKDLKKTLLIFTDGEETRSGVSQKEILDLVSDADENNLKIVVVGTGTTQGKTIPNIMYEGKPVVSKLNEELLRKLGKKYYYANDYAAINLAEEISRDLTEKESQTYATDDKVHDRYFQIPLAIAIFFLLINLFFPDRDKRT